MPAASCPRHMPILLQFSCEQGARHTIKIGSRGGGRKPRRGKQRGNGPGLPGAEFDDHKAARRQQRGRRERQSPDKNPARRRRHRARARGSKARTSGRQIGDLAGGDIGRIGHDQGRSATRSAAAISQATNAARLKPSRRALSRATSSAPALTSVPIAKGIRQFAEQRQAAARRSRCRDRQCAAARARAVSPSMAASAASTTVSVSGRGTSVAAPIAQRQAPKFLGRRRCARPARRQRRRRAKAAIALCSPTMSAGALAAAASPAWSRRSAWPMRMRASSSGESIPPARKCVAHARRASATVIAGVLLAPAPGAAATALVGFGRGRIRPFPRPRAVPPDARRPAHR